MIERCSACHAESYARRELAKGDALLREADLAKAKIIDIANMQFEEGSIDDMTRFSIYREATAHRFSAYMGGFHNTANFAWDEGYLELVSGIVAERDNLIVTKKLSIIQGKIGEILPIGIAGLAVALVSISLVIWMLIRNRKISKRKAAESVQDGN